MFIQLRAAAASRHLHELPVAHQAQEWQAACLQGRLDVEGTGTHDGRHARVSEGLHPPPAYSLKACFQLYLHLPATEPSDVDLPRRPAGAC